MNETEFEIGSWAEIVDYGGDCTDGYDPPIGIRVKIVKAPEPEHNWGRLDREIHHEIENGRVFVDWKFYHGKLPPGYSDRYDRCWPMEPSFLKKVS